MSPFRLNPTWPTPPPSPCAEVAADEVVLDVIVVACRSTTTDRLPHRQTGVGFHGTVVGDFVVVNVDVLVVAEPTHWSDPVTTPSR